MTPPPIRFAEVRAWLLDKALPLWSGPGLDRRFGGSVEALDFSGADAALPVKRVRAQARQVYVFTHLDLLGAGSADAARHCWDFLSAKARRADGAWARLLARDGSIADGAADAYDHAFILLALAWRARAGEPGAVGEAHATLDVLDRLLSLGPGRGWAAAEDRPQARLQNPHMHLLEAALELTLVSGDQRFAEMARAILRLFETRLFEPERGLIYEDSAEDWGALPRGASPVEPGHLFQWSWLLHRAGEVLGVDHRAEAAALYRAAERLGTDPETGLTYDGLEGAGLEPVRTFRTWPQTEHLKAALGMFEHQGLDTRAEVAALVGRLLDRYLAAPVAGGWVDRFGPGWTPLAQDMPASTFYHLLVAFSELLRLEPALSAARETAEA
ncbi:MAG TPA: AGE family epimerase/isomerase [Caulobacteraceae bacterium]